MISTSCTGFFCGTQHVHSPLPPVPAWIALTFPIIGLDAGAVTSELSSSQAPPTLRPRCPAHLWVSRFSLSPQLSFPLARRLAYSRGETTCSTAKTTATQYLCSPRTSQNDRGSTLHVSKISINFFYR